MPITVNKGKSAAAASAEVPVEQPVTPGGSPHEQVMAAPVGEYTKTVTKAGEDEPMEQDHWQEEGAMVTLPKVYETIEVGMSFKMPVASYTMLEFSVRRTTPFNPAEADADSVFDATREWVETKLNGLIEEQQSES